MIKEKQSYIRKIIQKIQRIDEQVLVSSKAPMRSMGENTKKAGFLLTVFHRRPAAQGVLVSAHKGSRFICLQVHNFMAFYGPISFKTIYLINFYGRKT